MALGGIATTVILMLRGVAPLEVLGSGVIDEHSTAIFAGNAIGLILGLGVLAYIVARLQTPTPWAFLQVRRFSILHMGLGVVGLLALLPVASWLGTLNELLPLPEFITAMDEQQLELIEAVLAGKMSFWISLLLAAVTPAVCEELFFRGLLQRNLERAWGVAAAIIVCGVVFGLFHLRLTEVLPLIAIGIYLAYLAWVTGSLWVPIVVHFVNNAVVLIVGRVAASRSDIDLDSLEASILPWYVVALGAVILVMVILALFRRREVRDHGP